LAFTLVAALVVSAPVAAPVSASVAEPSRPVAGSIGLRLVDVPVSAGSDPRAQMYIVDHLAPGTVIHRRIEVSNGSTAIAAVAIYPAAAAIVRGSFIGAASNTANDLSSWTSVTPDVAEIANGGRAIATVTISVPHDAAPGEQYAVVWAEVRSSTLDGGITQVSRVGVRLYISVGPGGPPPADFTIDSLTAVRSPDGAPSVIASVHNTGGRALDISGIMTLSHGPAGLSAGPFAVDLGVTLAVDATEPVTIPLDELLPAGPWRATITLHSGLVERSASATLTFADVGTATPVAVGTSTRPGRPYAMIAGSAAALLLAVAIVGAILKRRRPRAQGLPPAPSRTGRRGASLQPRLRGRQS
jgi:hypothetical protein